MTGSALFDFLIGLIVLFAVTALFMLVLPRISKDALFTQIARIVIGVLALIAFLFAVKAVLFGGGGALAVNGLSLVYFGIALIVVLLVLYLVDLFLTSFGAMIGLSGFTAVIQYVIGALALIALLYVASIVLFGGGGGIHLPAWR